MGIGPLDLPNKLAPTPQETPKYSVNIEDSQGNNVVLGDPNATRAALALMNMHAVNGGAACHWGGPAAMAELMSALHGLMFRQSGQWYEQFNFVNDAGHAENGLYALRANLGFDNLTFEDLQKFRSIDSKLTGHGEAHLNPEGVLLSNGPLGSALPQAQGLALADRLSKNNRVTICVMSDGAAMEGEAKEALSAIPGLAHKEKLNPFILIISDNNTKLSGRIDADSFDMAPSFEALNALGWNVIPIKDGHNLAKVYQKLEVAIDEAKAHPSRPVCVWAKTIKGKGVKATEESPSGGHGYPLKKFDEKIIDFLQEIYEGDAPIEFMDWAKKITKKPPSQKKESSDDIPREKIQAGFARAMSWAVQEKSLPVFSVSADLQGSTGVKAFHKEFPGHFVEVGVAESNMVSTAVGLSKSGYIPVVDTFAQFGVTKGALPLTMGNLSMAPVIALFSHTGFQDAADGASHQATTYFASVSAIPNTVVVCCYCSKEAESYLKHAIQTFASDRLAGHPGQSYVFFVGRENFPAHFEGATHYEFGKAQVLKNFQEADVVLVGCGPMAHKLMRAKDKFLELGISPIIINNSFINRPDVHTIGKALERGGQKLITLEEHQVTGGMGAQLIHSLKQNGYRFTARSLGIDNKFGQSAYKADDLYHMHNLDTRGLIEAYKEMHNA